MIDMVLNQIGTVFQVDNILEAEYELESDLVINFSNRTADLNCDGVANAGDLKLTILAGSLFVAEYLDGASAREGPIAVETDDLLASAYFTHTGEPNLFDDVGVLGAYEVTKFNMNLSLESAAGKWFFEATGRFFNLVNDGGTAFAYAESTAAVDLTPDDVSKKKGN